MSNCIFIDKKTQEVRIPLSGIKPELLEMIKKAQEDERAYPDVNTPADYYHVWWFLSSNSEIVGDELIVLLGKGRSTHTHRDFTGLARTMRKYLTIPLTVRVIAEDEGFPGKFTLSVTWGGPLPILKEVDFWNERIRYYTFYQDEQSLLQALEEKKIDYQIEEDLVAREKAIQHFAKMAPLKFNTDQAPLNVIK